MPRRSPGEGSISRRPDGRWQGALQVNGVRRVIYAKSEREAKAKIQALQREAYVNGALPDPGRKTVDDLLDAWIENVAPTLKPRTIADYHAVCGRYIRPILGKIRLARLTPEHVQRMCTRLQATGAKRVPSYAFALIHRACEVAVLWGWLASNPCDRVLRPIHRAERKDVWSPADLRRFLDGTQDSWLHPLWVVAVATGARLGELLALTWADVDWETPAINIRRSVQWIGGAHVFSTPKTRSGERTIVIPQEAVAALKKQRAQQAAWRLKAGASWQGNTELVFSGTGGPLLHSTVDRAMRRECDRLSLPRLTPHGLRHLSASLLLDRGLALPAVSARLGHANPNITAAVYSHAIRGQDKQAAETLQQALGRI